MCIFNQQFNHVIDKLQIVTIVPERDYIIIYLLGAAYEGFKLKNCKCSLKLDGAIV